MKLTPEQKEVVAISEGRHLVLAPPGSGKTQMLSQRILRALDRGIPPERMLCATFTNRAAFEMRDRVTAEGGTRTLPEVGNLHHFCQRFLKSVGRLGRGQHVLDEADQIGFIKEVVGVLRTELEEGPSADLRRTHGVTVASLIENLTDVRRQALDDMLTELFAEYEARDKTPYGDILTAALIVHQQRIGIPVRCLRRIPSEMLELRREGVIYAIARAYTHLKRNFRSLDFDDLLNETYLYLKQQPLTDEQRFDWVQVDEVQDLNPLQWRIIEGLTSRSAVSVYFGDLEQAIFSFLGASSTNFRQAVEGCPRHYFKTNFRATPLLLEVLMRFSLENLRSEWEFLPAPSDVTRANGILTLEHSSGRDLLATHLRSLLDSHIAENVAILVRTNQEADWHERHVRQLGYRYAKVSGLDLFSYTPMRDFLAFIALFTDNTSRSDWVRLFRRFAEGVDSLTSARYFVREMYAARWKPSCLLEDRNPIPRFPSRTRISRWAWLHRKTLKSLRNTLLSSHKTISRKTSRSYSFRQAFTHFQELALHGRTRYSLRELWPERGGPRNANDPADWESAREHALERIEKFLRYTDAIYRTDSRCWRDILTDDWEQLSKMKEADLLVGDESVVISTIHKAKGRQFDAVIIPNAADVLKGDYGADRDECARLFYVAMSRAKRHLSLFGVDQETNISAIAPCFRPGYESYYTKRARGGDCADDWLYRWERLAALVRTQTDPGDEVERFIVSAHDPVVRMALKAACNLSDSDRRAALFRACLHRFKKGLDSNNDARRHRSKTDGSTSISAPLVAETSAGTLIDCVRQCNQFDRETFDTVRAIALRTEYSPVLSAALQYYVASKRNEPVSAAFAQNAVGDLLYCDNADIRIEAAHILSEWGEPKWKTLIRGYQSDFLLLQSISDPTRENAVLTMLDFATSSRREKQLRLILIHRAPSRL